MTNQIRYQYEEIQQVARRFRDQNDRADGLIRRALYCLRRMDDGVWEGRGADEYREEMEDIVLPALRRLAAVMGDTAWTLDKAADMMREAEEMGAHLFTSEGTPLNVNFESIGFMGNTFGGGFGGWSAGEIRRLSEVFSGLGGRRDDLAAVSQVDDEKLDRRFGGRFFEEARRIIEGSGPNPDIPPVLPGLNGPVVTPPWFTENNSTDGGLNGASDAAVMVAGAGDHERMVGDIAKTSQALGGTPVSGVFAVQEGEVLRGPGAIAGAVATVNPAVQALMDWVRAHPNGLFILPPWSAAYGADALNALAAEGFDLSKLNVVSFGDSNLTLPEGLNHRVVGGLADLKA